MLASQLVTAHELEAAKQVLESELERAKQMTAEPLCNRILWWRREKRVKDNGGWDESDPLDENVRNQYRILC